MFASEIIHAIAKHRFQAAQEILTHHQQAICEQKIDLNEAISAGEHAGHLLAPLALSTLIELYKNKDKHPQEDHLAQFKACRKLFNNILFLTPYFHHLKKNAQDKSTFSICLENFSEIRNIIEKNEESSGAWLFLLIPLLSYLKNNDKDFKDIENLVSILLNQRAYLNLKDIHGISPLWYLVFHSMWATAAAMLNLAEQDKNFKVEVDIVHQKSRSTLLHVAVRALAKLLKNKNANPKDIETAKKLVQLLINQGADLHAKNKFGETPLLMLVDWDIWEPVTAMLHRAEQDKNFKVEMDTAVPTTQDTLLHIAVKALAELLNNKNANPKDIETAKKLVQLLINQGADLHAKNKLGETPLLVLVNCDIWEPVTAMLHRAEQDKNFKIAVDTAFPETQNTLLHVAVRALAKLLANTSADPKDIETAKKLVQLLVNQGADLHAKNKLGETPLLMLVNWCIWEPVAAMLHRAEQDKNFKIAVDTAVPGTQETLLHIAVTALAKLLVDTSADPKDIETAKKLVQLLVNQGADLHAKNKLGETPLLVLVNCDIWEPVTAMLHRAEQDKNFKIAVDTAFPETQNTLLHVAVRALAGLLNNKNANPKDIETAKKLVQLLVNQGADFNVKNSHGKTPLLLLVHFDIWEPVAAMLHRAEQDKNFKIAVDTAFPETQNTLLHVAVRALAGLLNNNANPKDIETAKKLVQLLVNQGADFNVKNSYGRTPLLMLVSWGIWEPVAAMLHRAEQDKNFKIAVDTTSPETQNTLLHIVVIALSNLLNNNANPKDIETAKKLMQLSINQGADLHAKNKFGETPLLVLVNCNIWEPVATMLHHAEQDKNFKIAVDTAFPETQD